MINYVSQVSFSSLGSLVDKKCQFSTAYAGIVVLFIILADLHTKNFWEDFSRYEFRLSVALRVQKIE